MKKDGEVVIIGEPIVTVKDAVDQYIKLQEYIESLEKDIRTLRRSKDNTDEAIAKDERPTVQLLYSTLQEKRAALKEFGERALKF